MPRKLDFGASGEDSAPAREPLPFKPSPREPIDPALARAATRRARIDGFVPREAGSSERTGQGSVAGPPQVPAEALSQDFGEEPVMGERPARLATAPPGLELAHAVGAQTGPVGTNGAAQASNIPNPAIPVARGCNAKSAHGDHAHTMRRRPGRPRREPQTRVSLAGPVRVIERFQRFCLERGDVTYWQGIELLLDETGDE